MSTLKLLSILFALSCCDQAASEVCRWTKFQMRQLNDLSILKLSDMANVSSSSGHFPIECLGKEKVSRLFPENLYNSIRREDVTVVALKTFEHVAQIFINNLTSVSWDTDKLKLFTNYIYRQIKKLNGCVGEAGASPGQRERVSAVSESLQTLFDQLSGILKEKKNNACAWETVRLEVRYILLSFKKFIESHE
ncbi:interferon a3-like [Hypomesus transpacificus]|uniref:interferon a3-like n=1 Tax=Hypomesus transpacificus TaxID=137520 RepID=UPI001F07FB6A|nr:interferon a3-like [Hypomesus transpacificus]